MKLQSNEGGNIPQGNQYVSLQAACQQALGLA